MGKIVLDVDQMKHLEGLGVDTSKASMCYRRKTRDMRGESKVGRWSLAINQPVIVSNFETYEEVPAFTLQIFWICFQKKLRIKMMINSY